MNSNCFLQIHWLAVLDDGNYPNVRMSYRRAVLKVALKKEMAVLTACARMCQVAS
jgi:hypothetical protein